MLAEDTLATLRLAAAAAADKKAFQLAAYDVAELTSYADTFLICSAASERQVGAVVDEIRVRLKGAGRPPLSVEGESHSDWVLLDYGDLIVHVFTEERRSYYGLDTLWRDARLEDEGLLGDGGDSAAR